MKATIYKSTGSWYLAHNEGKGFIKCRLAGKLKLDREISSSNPIAVGDHVEITPEEHQDTAVITHILERKNYIVRASPHQKIRRQVLASNIDQAVLLATLRYPLTSRGFIDRFLVTAAAYHVPAILIFNKTDTYREKEQEQLALIKETYGKMDYKVLATSFKKESLSSLHSILKDKMSLLAGHSGVGKSTLINQLIPQKSLKTQDVSQWSGKGLHTTTFSEMFDLPSGGKIIDTPGIREWGLVDMEATELSHYFKDMQPYIGHCKFNNCLHLDEPGCVVKEAVAEAEIDFSRFESYLSILASLEAKS